MQELGVLKMRGTYFGKILDSVGVQVRLSRERIMCSQIITVDFW